MNESMSRNNFEITLISSLTCLLINITLDHRPTCSLHEVISIRFLCDKMVNCVINVVLMGFH